MNLISKQQFLEQNDTSYEEVCVPHWGTIRLRSLDGKGRDQYLNNAFTRGEDGTLTAKIEDGESYLLALTMVDENGALWFDNVEEGVRVLREKNVGSLQIAFTFVGQAHVVV